MSKLEPNLKRAKQLIGELNEELLQANKKANPVEHINLMYLIEDTTDLSLRLQQFLNAVEERDEKSKD
jgi:hypothetical protein